MEVSGFLEQVYLANSVVQDQCQPRNFSRLCRTTTWWKGLWKLMSGVVPRPAVASGTIYFARKSTLMLFKKPRSVENVRTKRCANGTRGVMIHSVLRCKTCSIVWNRDVLAAINILVGYYLIIIALIFKYIYYCKTYTHTGHRFSTCSKASASNSWEEYLKTFATTLKVDKIRL